MTAYLPYFKHNSINSARLMLIIHTCVGMSLWMCLGLHHLSLCECVVLSHTCLLPRSEPVFVRTCHVITIFRVGEGRAYTHGCNAEEVVMCRERYQSAFPMSLRCYSLTKSAFHWVRGGKVTFRVAWLLRHYFGMTSGVMSEDCWMTLIGRVHPPVIQNPCLYRTCKYKQGSDCMHSIVRF